MKGAVAGGSQATVQAGLAALRAGGNAVDAAIASTLMAGVAEPLLTGLGGSGLATVRFDNHYYQCDFFADMPGLANPAAGASPMEMVSINFGPTTQDFFVGPGSASVPGVPSGLWALHDRYGSVDMPTLAEPAAIAAENGVAVTPGFERVIQLLWPIISRTPDMRELFAPGGSPLKKGDLFRCPDLGRTIRSFAEVGDEFFRTGDAADAFLDSISGESRITAQDFANQRPVFRSALPATYRDSTLWIPGPPSAAGVGVAHTLSTLENYGAPTEPTSFETIQRLRNALTTVVRMRSRAFFTDMFTDGFGPAFIARVNASRSGTPPPGAGYTTHISTVDENRNAVAITHSLGETAGLLAGDTGVIINNFLGETDVNPPFLRRPSGGRLITMCCPSILETADGRIIAMGSGGSSRIPTAVVHGAMYIVDHDWTVRDAVEGPRTHIEADRLHVEADGRSEATMTRALSADPALARFDGPNMFFGGLHAACVGDHGFSGHGDPRRSGAFGVIE